MEHWIFDYEFFKQIVLISIPIVLGIITSSKITKSWQERKDRSELIFKVLGEFDEYCMGPYVLSQSSVLMIDNVMTLVVKLTTSDVSVLKEMQKELPEINEKITKDCKKMDTNLEKMGDSMINFWKFESTLMVYYDSEKLRDEFRELLFLNNDLTSALGESLTNIRPLMDKQSENYLGKISSDAAKKIEDEWSQEIDKKLDEYFDKAMVFRTKLLKKPLII